MVSKLKRLQVETLAKERELITKSCSFRFYFQFYLIKVCNFARTKMTDVIITLNSDKNFKFILYMSMI